MAKRLAAFECRLFYCDPVRLSPDKEQELQAIRIAFDKLLELSDFVVLVVPLNANTLGLFDADALACMNHGSYLIEPARGSVVDENAVAESLALGHLGGCAADVFEMEAWARADRPSRICQKLLDLSDRTFLTPHLGSAVEAARREIAMEAARNIADALQGKRPRSAINDPVPLH